MFVDSDVELAKNCIGTLLTEIQGFGWVGIHARLLSTENISYWQKGQDMVYSQYYSHTGPIDRIDTIVAMFRRNVLRKFPFDPYFKESAEDVELCQRLRAAGLGLGVSSAIAYHYHRREFRDFVKQRFRNGIGKARLSVKCDEKMIILGPVATTMSLVIRNMFSRRLTCIPFFFVSGIAEFIGVLYGLRKINQEYPSAKGNERYSG